jgi:hypothetical protein
MPGSLFFLAWSESISFFARRSYLTRGLGLCLPRLIDRLTKFPDLDDLRAAFWAPRSNNRMNASAANALYV